jgi:hypothetical protein
MLLEDPEAVAEAASRWRTSMVDTFSVMVFAACFAPRLC